MRLKTLIGIVLQSARAVNIDNTFHRCLPCKRLEPHFVAAARRLAKNDPPVILGTINVPDNIELTKRFGLQQYPYLVMLRYGEVYNYTGPQEEEGNIHILDTLP